ncbi:MAG: hypothetical protein JO151_05230 [Verrucomicrobia bacterium]|nr:hypothetical protein [Verrucomicrobiota bacterium]
MELRSSGVAGVQELQELQELQEFRSWKSSGVGRVQELQNETTILGGKESSCAQSRLQGYVVFSQKAEAPELL